MASRICASGRSRGVAPVPIVDCSISGVGAKCAEGEVLFEISMVEAKDIGCSFWRVGEGGTRGQELSRTHDAGVEGCGCASGSCGFACDGGAAAPLELPTPAICGVAGLDEEDDEKRRA